MEVLDYHRLKIFKTVADLKSFSKAAELLFLAQPTVTLQIKKLENYLGVTLFYRKKNEVELTQEGKVLYKYAEKILEDYILMEKELLSIKDNIKQHLTIGASTTIGEYFLPSVLAKFWKEFKDTKINVFIGNSKEVEEGVLSKTFNIGLIEDEISSNKLFIKSFYKDEIILIASKHNPIPSQIDIYDLVNYKFIFREVGSGTRNIIETYLKKYDILKELDIVMEVRSSKAISNIVKRTDLIAFVSEIVVEEDLKKGNLKKVFIEDFSIKRDFSFITQKNIRLSAVENEFLNRLLNTSQYY
ncbi:MAG: LysR family transcriptional regulator [Aquificae bacterium]|nr:LysR family transcriptional regulator [Aquificota bacterium]